MLTRVLVLGINFHPELTGIGEYTGEFVDWLASNGYRCSVVTGFPYYPQWKIQAPYHGSFYLNETTDQGAVDIYRCPLYVPSQPTSLKRILQDASFSVSSFLVVLFLLFKPRHEYIFCPAPPFHLALLGMFYRFFKGGTIIYHLQDLQVDAAKELGLIKNPRFIGLMLRLERFIIERVDVVSTISAGMVRKVKTKTAKPIRFLPNWVDIRDFSPVVDKSKLREEWGFSADDKIILYSGAIGEKQGLEDILAVAQRLQGNPSIKFVICGSGPYKAKLQRDVETSKLENVVFYPLQPLDRLNEFLNLADVHLVIQKTKAADLVMPSKLTTILAVGGLAVVTADPGSSLYGDLNLFETGLICEPNNQGALLESIQLALRYEHDNVRANARKYAVTHLDQNEIISIFMEGLKGECPHSVLAEVS